MKIFVAQSKVISFMTGKAESFESKATFAKVAKRGIKSGSKSRSLSRSRPKKLFTAIIKPKSEQSNDTTLKDVKSLVNPKDLNVVINDVRRIRDGGIVINTNSKDDIDKIITG